MEFYDIDKKEKVTPGEYILHVPSEAIVMCGAFSRTQNKIKALSAGQLVEDNIENFKKIRLTRREHKERQVRTCGGCKKT
jgi:hypothetical protein